MIQKLGSPQVEGTAGAKAQAETQLPGKWALRLQSKEPRKAEIKIIIIIF